MVVVNTKYLLNMCMIELLKITLHFDATAGGCDNTELSQGLLRPSTSTNAMLKHSKERVYGSIKKSSEDSDDGVPSSDRDSAVQSEETTTHSANRPTHMQVGENLA